MSVAWLKVTPEGQQIETIFKSHAEEVKSDLETWLSSQLEQYKQNRERIIHREDYLDFEDDDDDDDSPTQIGWALESPDHLHTRNVTESFERVFHSSLPLSDLLPSHLKNDIFLFVPGLFTQWYPGYMSHLLSASRELGLITSSCPINTAASIDDNARVVASIITNMTKIYPKSKVVIIGHSKGVLDAMAAFAMFPQIIPKVSALVAFQAPWGGSAIANDVLSAYHRRAVTSAFVEKILNGNSDALLGTRYSDRQKWIKENPLPLGLIPTISVATHVNSFKSLLKASTDYVRLRYGELSDGCVATKDAIIPGTLLVEIPQLDHFGPAYNGFPACCTNQEPLRVQLALLKVLFDELDKQDNNEPDQENDDDDE